MIKTQLLRKTPTHEHEFTRESEGTTNPMSAHDVAVLQLLPDDRITCGWVTLDLDIEDAKDVTIALCRYTAALENQNDPLHPLYGNDTFTAIRLGDLCRRLMIALTGQGW